MIDDEKVSSTTEKSKEQSINKAENITEARHNDNKKVLKEVSLIEEAQKINRIEAKDTTSSNKVDKEAKSQNLQSFKEQNLLAEDEYSKNITSLSINKDKDNGNNQSVSKFDTEVTEAKYIDNDIKKIQSTKQTENITEAKYNENSERIKDILSILKKQATILKEKIDNNQSNSVEVRVLSKYDENIKNLKSVLSKNIEDKTISSQIKKILDRLEDSVNKNSILSILNDTSEEFHKDIKTLLGDKTVKQVLNQTIPAPLMSVANKDINKLTKNETNLLQKELTEKTKYSSISSMSNITNATKELLTTIANGEGTTLAKAKRHGYKSEYDVTLGYGRYVDDKSKPLTSMTIGEVKKLQKKMIKNGASSTAVGKYQFINSTLKELQAKNKLSDDTVFTKEVQDKFAKDLLEKRGLSKFKKGKISQATFQRNLSKEWASIAKDSSNKSYYGQHVGTSDKKIDNALQKVKFADISTHKTNIIENIENVKKSKAIAKQNELKTLKPIDNRHHIQKMENSIVSHIKEGNQTLKANNINSATNLYNNNTSTSSSTNDPKIVIDLTPKSKNLEV